VESVTIRKAEIEAAVRLTAAIGELLRSPREEIELGGSGDLDEVVDAER
jgi:hypothetical protein